MDHPSGLAHCRARLLGRRIGDVEIGVGTMLTFSFDDTAVRLWLYMSAWNIASPDGIVLACEDDRATYPEKLSTLTGLTVTKFDADGCNNLTLGLSDDVVLRALATFSDEDPWMLFKNGAWILGARPDGRFELEVG